MLGINGKEGRVRDLRGKFRLVHLAGGRTEAADIDAFAVAFSNSEGGAVSYEFEACISPEVHIKVFGLAGQSGERKEEEQAECAAAAYEQARKQSGEKMHHFLAGTACVQLSPCGKRAKYRNFTGVSPSLILEWTVIASGRSM